MVVNLSIIYSKYTKLSTYSSRGPVYDTPYMNLQINYKAAPLSHLPRTTTRQHASNNY